jgi:hypothetical protein
VQERKGEKRATLNQLLDDLQKALKKTSASSSSLSTRGELEWLVQEMLLQGLLKLEFGFTAYATNTYLMATSEAHRLGRTRYVVRVWRMAWQVSLPVLFAGTTLYWCPPRTPPPAFLCPALPL